MRGVGYDCGDCREGLIVNPNRTACLGNYLQLVCSCDGRMHKLVVVGMRFKF